MVNLSIKLGSCGSNFDKIAKVYIDWNSDKDFDDVGETVMTTTLSKNPATFTESITVPASAVPGSTRMRVVCRETNTSSDVTSCGTYGYGETEDYTVVVVALAATNNTTIWDGTNWDNSIPTASLKAIVQGNYSGNGFEVDTLIINAGITFSPLRM